MIDLYYSTHMPQEYQFHHTFVLLLYLKVGWDSDTNTWEPVEHLAEDCKEKLEDFERRWKKRQERREEKRMEEKKKRKEERRQKELKAAARWKSWFNLVLASHITYFSLFPQIFFKA